MSYIVGKITGKDLVRNRRVYQFFAWEDLGVDFSNYPASILSSKMVKCSLDSEIVILTKHDDVKEACWSYKLLYQSFIHDRGCYNVSRYANLIFFHANKYKAKQSVLNGTHPFLGNAQSWKPAALQKATQARRDKGINNVAGLWDNTKPWDNVASTPETRLVWAKALEAYQWYQSVKHLEAAGKYGAGYKTLARHFGIEPCSSTHVMVRYLRDGWNPLEDEDWLATYLPLH